MSDLRGLVADFLVALDLERNYSPNTGKAYRAALGQFLAWLSHQGQPGELSGLTPGAVREFLAHLRDQRHNDPRSIQLKLTALKSFVAYLREALPAPLAQQLPRLNWQYKAGRKVQRALRDDELDKLLEAAYREREQLHADLAQALGPAPRLAKQAANASRNVLILLLLAGAGLRVSEVCGLNLSDVDLANRTIRVMGKGRKEREVFFDVPEMVQAMDGYLALPGGASPAGAIFRNSRDGGRLTTRSVQFLLQHYRDLAGLEGKVTPHTLRHTFATLSIERGANVKAVSQLLGHAQVTTTLQMYTHLSEEHVRKVFRLCHPRAEVHLPLEQVVELRRRALMYIHDAAGTGQRRAAATG